MLDEKGIADGGCMGVVISRASHDRLCRADVITQMLPPSRAIAIGFGTTQEGTQEAVVGVVSRPGFLVDEILVVQSIVATLVGDDVFTDKGLWLLKDAESMLCVYNISVLAVARRAAQTPEGALWLMDFTALCRVRDPRLRSSQTTTLASVSERMGLVEDSLSTGEAEEVEEDDGPTLDRSWQDGVVSGPAAQPAVQVGYLARSQRYSPADVRQAERVIARSKIGARTLAKIVAAGSWSGIPDNLTSALLKGVAERREDIPYLLTHSKSTHAVGSGIAPGLGQAMYIDIWGKYPVGANGTCFIAQVGDVFCSWGRLYAMKGKDALLGAMRRYLTTAKSYGHRYREVYSDCAGEVKDQFVVAAAQLGLQVLKSAPEQFGVGPGERNTQTLKQEMAWRLLAQENLTTAHYFFAGVDAQEARNACLNGSDPTRTPEEQFTGKPPIFEQRTRFSFGSLAASKVIGQQTASKVGPVPARYELVCVVVSPNATPDHNMVLRQGHTTPVVRRGLKRIGQPKVLRTPDEWAKLMPVFSADGDLLSFHAPAKMDFNLSDLLALAGDRAAEPAGSLVSDATGYVTRDGSLHAWPQGNSEDVAEPNAVRTESMLRDMCSSENGTSGLSCGGASSAGISSSNASSGVARNNNTSSNGSGIPVLMDLFVTEGDETEVVGLPTDAELLAEAGVDALEEITVADSDEDQDAVVSLGLHAKKGLSLAAQARMVSFDDIMEHGATPQAAFDQYFSSSRVCSAFAARAVHGRLMGPPSMSQVLRSNDLQAKWEHAVRAFIDTGLAEGGHFYLNPEQVASGEYTILPHVNVFDEKRIRLGESTAKLKYRLAIDGSKEARGDFPAGSVETAPAGSEQVLHIISMAAAMDLQLSKEDDKNAFPRHNAVSDPAVRHPRKLCTWLNGWQTGDGVGRYLAFATLTNGLRDASAIFDEIKTRELLGLGFKRTGAHRSVYYKHDGQGGFMALAVSVDDTVTARTRNLQGQCMYREVQRRMAAKGFQVVSEQLDDCPGGITFAGMDVRKFENARGRGISVTMQGMVHSVQESVEEFEATSPAECTAAQQVWMPLTPGWTPLAAAQGMRSGEDRAPVLPYLTLVGQMIWVESVAPRSCVPSTLCSFSRSPGMGDWACLVQSAKYFLATAHLPLMFYQDAQAIERGITVPMEQHVFVDAGVTGVADGSGRLAYMLKMGSPGTRSGGYIFHTRQILEGASTISDETAALVACIPRVLASRFLSEELAGQRVDPYDTRHTPGEFNATVTFMDETTALALVSREKGDTDCPVRTQSMLRLQREDARAGARCRARARREPTAVFSDSMMVLDIVHKDGKVRQKNTRALLRQFALVHQAQRDEHIAATHVSSAENLINPLSKLPQGPLTQANGLEGLLGESDEMDAYLLEARAQFGKGVRALKATPHSGSTPQWLGALRPAIGDMPAMQKFLAQSSDDNNFLPSPSRSSSDKRGLGMPAELDGARQGAVRDGRDLRCPSGRTMARGPRPPPPPPPPPPLPLPPRVTQGRALYSVGSVRDVSCISYSARYLDLGIPDPASVAGERHCQHNTECNVDRERAGQVERLILANRSKAVQLSGIDSLEELSSWEDHQQFLLQQNARRAVTLTAAVEQRFAEEDARLVRAAFVVRRREEQCADQPLGAGWFQMISCSSQWVDKMRNMQPYHPREQGHSEGSVPSNFKSRRQAQRVRRAIQRQAAKTR